MKNFIITNIKKIIIIVIADILIIAILVVNHVVVHKGIPSNISIKIVRKDVNVFETVKIKDLISHNNIEIINKNTLVNTNAIGEKKIKVLYKYKGFKYVYYLKINIVDKKPPLIFSGTYKTVLVGKDHDFCASASYGDNYDRKPSCKVVGDYDVNKEGTYKLDLQITDSSGNKASSKAILNVIKKSVNSKSQESKKIEFSNVLTNYKTDENEVGIDVSKWQGDVDYNKVKDAGCSFVMMRMGVQSGKDKEIELDNYFEKNYENAKKAGLKIGIYVYSTAIKKDTAIKHAKWAIKHLNKKKIDLPIAFDWENWAYWKEYNMNFNDINEIANSFIYTVNNAGYNGILYSSKYHLENIWENKNDYPVWLAHYTSNTSYKGNYIMWQLTNIGRIDGINGDVDINILYSKK